MISARQRARVGRLSPVLRDKILRAILAQLYRPPPRQSLGGTPGGSRYRRFAGRAQRRFKTYPDRMRGYRLRYPK